MWNMTERTVTGERITRRPAIELDLAPREWLLSFVAGCSVVLESQVAKLLTIRGDADADLVAQLRAEGSIEDAPRLRHQRGAYRITADGLRAIGSDMPVPRIDLRRYWLEVGAGWLAVGVRRGIFGADVERLYTRREMAAADRRMADAAGMPDPSWSDAVRRKAADASFAVRRGGDDADGAGGPHYPDLTLVIAHGRVAMQLVPAFQSRGELDGIIDAYVQKPPLARTVLIVPDAATQESVAEVIERRGAGERVAVQRARFALR